MSTPISTERKITPPSQEEAERVATALIFIAAVGYALGRRLFTDIRSRWNQRPR